MSKTDGKILVVDDDPDVLVTLRLLLKRRFTHVVTESDPVNIYKHFSKDAFDVVLLDMNFSPGVTSGREGIRWLKEIMKKYPDTNVVMNTAYGDVELAVQAMKEGATDFIVKPWDEEKMISTINAAIQVSRSRKEVKEQQPKKNKAAEEFEQDQQEMISESPAMEPVFETIDKVAGTDANVLILGENGTGKELVARDIHQQSTRADEPFVKVDLGAIPESLFEAELFGHTKGAFTDAKQDRPGRFEMAHGGTLFLDEIGNLSHPLQSKLLSALQSRMITRVGSNEQIPINIRLLCATNMKLYEMVEKGDFRQDLLYRINTVEINLPPLRKRVEDIQVLAEYYLEIYGRKYDKTIERLSQEAIDKMRNYHWPGNIRELQHTLERAVIMCDGHTLQADGILLSAPQKSATEETPTAAHASGEQMPPTLNIEELEKQAIRTAIEKHDGNMSKAAKELGMGRNTLYRKMEKYGIG